MIPGMIQALFNDSQYHTLRVLLDSSYARHAALAGNVANVNTPGYQRQDTSPIFRQALDRAIKDGDMKTLRDLQPTVGIDADAPPVRMDGSNVNMERELVEMAKNSAQFEVSAMLMAKRYQQLRLAITGRG